MSSTTYVALLTPPGRGALATIEVRGPDAWSFTQDCLDRPVVQSATEPHRPWLRKFRGPEGTHEELIVAFPTGNTARIHCHGGQAACESILAAITAQGATRVTWQEFADPARVALAGALTERTALVLLDQGDGALENEIAEMLELLRSPENGPAVIVRIDALLARAPLGLHLTEPWRVVIAGRPNAGKSSLLNALLGYQRSIIHDEPGTTRDVVTARTAFDGWPVELRDTAGLRETGDELEAAGVERAEAEIRSADLVLYVIPADAAVEECEAERIAAEDLQAQGREVLIVRSKCDLVTLSPGKEEIPISAKTGQGLSTLIAAVIKRLVGIPPEPGSLLPFCPALVHQMQDARAALVSGQLSAARSVLQSMAVIDP